jgi:hypothetical protein
MDKIAVGWHMHRVMYYALWLVATLQLVGFGAGEEVAFEVRFVAMQSRYSYARHFCFSYFSSLFFRCTALLCSGAPTLRA